MDFNRRLFLACGLAPAYASRNRHVYRFTRADCDIEMMVEFHDGSGTGSRANVQYTVRPRFEACRIRTLREHVRTIDQDARLLVRPPVIRSVELEHGVASDLQSFTYTGTEPLPEGVAPWYYFRQDLYLDARSVPFLVLHWKHELNGIRLLDVIPGEGTRPEDTR